jgi:Tol biopolymer transport system component
VFSRGALIFCVTVGAACSDAPLPPAAAARGAAVVPTQVPVQWHPAMPLPLPGRLVFHSDREGRHRLFVLDQAGDTSRLTDGTDHHDEEAAVSPDGTRIAFTTTRFDYRTWDIAVWDLAAGSARRVTSHVAFERQPAWQPDGSALLFASEQDGTQAIFRVPVEGGRTERVSPGPNRTLMPAVSPDGRLLAFVEGSRDGLRVFVQDLATGKPRAITPPLETPATPRWSPDGRQIAFTRFAPDGTSTLAIVVVATGEMRAYPIDGIAAVREPAWSPDGQWLAASASSEIGAREDWDLILLRPDAPAAAVRITHGPARDRAPAWMPR